MSETANERTTIATFALGHMANDWTAGAMLLIAPAVADAFGGGAPEVGALLAAHGAAGALIYLPAGLLADRSARRLPLLAVTFLWVSLGYFAASFTSSLGAFTLVVSVAVLGDAAWHPIATGELTRRYPKRRANVLGLHAMGGTAGAEVLGPLCTGLALHYLSWQGALRLSVVPPAIMGLVFVLVLRHRLGEAEPSTAPPPIKRTLLRPWMTGPGRTFVAVIIAYNMAYMAVLSMTPVFLKEDLSYSPFWSGVFLAGLLAVGSLVQPSVGRLSDTAGRRPIIVAGLLLAAAFATLAGLLPPSWVTMGALLGVATMLSAIRPSVLAGAVEMAGDREASNLGVAFTLMDGVGALGALLAGQAAADSTRNAFLLGAVFCVVALLMSTRLPIAQPDQPSAANVS
jgi:FSR family fosmidomycin resistance protein-like MFS transporter